MGGVSRLLAVVSALLCLRCGGDRLRPVDPPDPRLPPPNAPVSPVPPAETPPPEEAPPKVPPPEEQPCLCAASINDGCAMNGHCDAGRACVWDTAANGTACTTAGLAGECIDRYCIPFDTQSYGAPPEPAPPWCPVSGVGLPATQTVNPVGGAACTIYGASQMAFGNCPIESYPLVSFEDTSLATRSQVRFDLRWLKLAGVISLRVKMPDEPSNLEFAITDYAWGAGLQGYKLSISDTPCDVGSTPSRYDATHCEGPGINQYAVIDAPNPANLPCHALHAGHIYYLNISGDGPADPAGDGVIDAGDRLLIGVTFNRP